MRKTLLYSMFLLIFLFSFLSFPKDTIFAKSFPDVNSSKVEITFLVNEGIIDGYPNGTFGPTNEISREQAAKMISVAKGYKLKNIAKKDVIFKDVPFHSWSLNYVHAVFENDIMVGVGHDRFEPKKAITKGEMAAVLVRAFNLTETADVHYADVPKEAWYSDDINKITVAGIVDGNNKNFNPKQIVNREQFAVMLARALNDHFKLNFKNEEVVKSIKYVKTDNDTNLNMRSGPGTKNDIIVRLPNQTEVKVLSDNDTWFFIDFNGIKGYVHSNYLSDNPLNEPLEKTSYKIVIDAGHGYQDSGANGFGLKEKDMVLDIANKTARYLEEKFANVEIIMTRSTDVFLTLAERSAIANEHEADYFFSMHLNAFNGKVGGFESFIYNQTVSQETIDRQKDIHTYIIKEMNNYSDDYKFNDRGMKKANFGVLRQTNMPALLIEYLFIDNKIENDFVKEDSYRTFLAETTAEAIALSFDLTRK